MIHDFIKSADAVRDEQLLDFDDDDMHRDWYAAARRALRYRLATENSYMCGAPPPPPRIGLTRLDGACRSPEYRAGRERGRLHAVAQRRA
jgi:hypothetical protein